MIGCTPHSQTPPVLRQSYPINYDTYRITHIHQLARSHHIRLRLFGVFYPDFRRRIKSSTAEQHSEYAKYMTMKHIWIRNEGFVALISVLLVSVFLMAMVLQNTL